MGLEIERKFLIRYPDTASLTGEVWEIEQTYLVAGRGETRRIRRVISQGRERFFYTEKRHVTNLTRIENEREISREEYAALSAERDTELNVIRKTRIRIPCGNRVWEVDLFPFWDDRALLEIELASEDEDFILPPFAELIREVTGEKEYTNRAIARKIPEK